MPLLSNGRCVGLDFISLANFIQEAKWGYHINEFWAVTEVRHLYKHLAVVMDMSCSDSAKYPRHLHKHAVVATDIPQQKEDQYFYPTGFTLATIWSEAAKWPLVDQKVFWDFANGEEIQIELDFYFEQLKRQRGNVRGLTESPPAGWEEAHKWEGTVGCEYLGSKVTIEEMEAENMTLVPLRVVPFGCNNEKWRRWRCQVELGCHLFTFHCYQGRTSGYGGYALVRDFKVIDSLTTMRA